VRVFVGNPPDGCIDHALPAALMGDDAEHRTGRRFLQGHEIAQSGSEEGSHGTTPAAGVSKQAAEMTEPTRHDPRMTKRSRAALAGDRRVIKACADPGSDTRSARLGQAFREELHAALNIVLSFMILAFITPLPSGKNTGVIS
jgi:hypothetical protein